MVKEQKQEKLFNYFYKITNLINGKYYYGIRSCNDISLDTKYMGSSRILKDSIEKYGIENFKKEIIIHYPTRKEVSDHESMVVNEDLVNDPQCYNLKTGGANGSVLILTEQHKKKISQTMQGRTFTDEHLKKLSESARKFRTPEEKENLRRKNLGKKASEETKIKMSNSRKGHLTSEETRKKISDAQMGEKNHRYGKFHTEEWKLKMSQLRKGKPGRIPSEESREKLSKNNRSNIPCIIEGLEFYNISQVCKYFNISRPTVKRRLDSDSPIWNSWKYKCL